MLRGLRTAIKYFTIGLLAGVLLAPRKGEETRKLLVDRGKEYAQELMDSGMREGQAMNRASRPSSS
jgi:gas vesicle protein